MGIFNNIWYWKIRKAWIKILFVIKRFVFKQRKMVEDYFEDASLKKRIILEILKSILSSVVIILLIIFVEKEAILCLGTISENNLFFKQVHTIILGCNKSIKCSADSLSDLLIGIISVVGIYLGLYCSNMMSVFTNIYANMPKEISSLFENDVITNKHINSITKYLLFMITILAINITGGNIGILLFLFCVIYGFKIIIAYGFTSKRTYQFSDTYYVTGYLHSELYKIIKMLSKKGVIYQDESIQNYYKIKAKKLLISLHIVNEYCIEKNDINKKSIESFVKSNFILLNEYWKIKRIIPYDSLWYDEKIVYPRWYNADYSEIIVAINTGTNIEMVKQKDALWFEEMIFSINEKCLKRIISDSNEVEIIYSWLNLYRELSKSAIEADELEFFLNKIDYIIRMSVEIIQKNKTRDTVMTVTQEILRIYAQILIDMRDYLQSIKLEDLLGDVLGPEALKTYPKNEYYNFENIRKIYLGIHYEAKLENRIITPSRFIQQELAEHMYEEIVKKYLIVEKIINNKILLLNDTLLENEKYEGLVVSCMILNEMRNKIELLLHSFDELLHSLEQYHIEKDIEWKDNPKNNITDSINCFFEKLPKQWLEYTGVVTLENWDNQDVNKTPDVLGACFNHIAGYLIKAIANKDYSSFENAYINFLTITFLYEEMIRKELYDKKTIYKESFIISSICNPFIEFSIISGYAYVLGEILNQDRWKRLVEDTFEKWIEKIALKQEKLDLINEAYKWYRDRALFYDNRYTLHIGWKQLINNTWGDLDELSWKRERFHEVLVSDSPLLNAVIKYRDRIDILKCDAFEVFAIMVVNKYQPEGKKYVSKDGWEDKLNEFTKL